MHISILYVFIRIRCNFLTLKCNFRFVTLGTLISCVTLKIKKNLNIVNIVKTYYKKMTGLDKKVMICVLFAIYI